MLCTLQVLPDGSEVEVMVDKLRDDVAVDLPRLAAADAHLQAAPIKHKVESIESRRA